MKGLGRCGGIAQYKGMLVGAQKVLVGTRSSDYRCKGHVLNPARGCYSMEWGAGQDKLR